MTDPTAAARRRGPRPATSSTSAGSYRVGMPQSPNHPQFWHTLPAPARRHGPRRRGQRRQRHDHHGHPRRHPHRRARPRLPRRPAARRRRRAEAGPRRQVRRARRAHHRADGLPRRAARRRRPPGRRRARGRLRDHRRRPRGDPRGRQASTIGAGDVVLVRSGWGRLFDEGARLRRPRHRACPAWPRPAPAGWPSTGARAVGADTIAFERLAPGGGHSLLPGAPRAAGRDGIYIVEAMDLEELAAAGGPRVHVRARPAQHLRRHRLAGAAAGGGAGVSERPWPQQLGDFAAGTTLDDLPDEVADSVGMRVLDMLGHRASPRRRSPPAAPPAAGPARPGRHAQSPRPSACPTGDLGRRWPPSSTACSRTPSTTTTPTCPRCCTPAPASCPPRWPPPSAPAPPAATLVRAVAVGLEVCVRLGMAGYDEDAGNSIFFEHGQHATSICGAMGGAVAAALLDTAAACRAERVVARPRRRRVDGRRASSRPTAPAARSSGCTAAGPRTPPSRPPTWSRHGFTGPPTVLEGRFGFFQAWLHDAGDLDAVTDGLGSHWAVPRHLLQALPGQPLHPRRRRRGRGAARARASRPERGRARSSSASRPPTCARSASRSRSSARPETGYMAQFSGAVRRHGRAARRRRARRLARGLHDDHAHDPARLGLMDRRRSCPTTSARAIFPHQFPAVAARDRCTDGTRARGARCSPPAAARSGRCRSTSSPPSSATTPRAASTTTASTGSREACRDLADQPTSRPARAADPASTRRPRPATRQPTPRGGPHDRPTTC